MEAQQVFTIKQTAELTGISEDTIRYYEKISLLPRAERKENGHRIYRQEDIETIQLLSCLKKTGMPLDEMRPFLGVAIDADPGEFPELVERLRNHRENIVSQIASLQQVVDFIDMKLEEGRYRRNCSDGSGNDAALTSPSAVEEPVAKPVSAVQMTYFSVPAKAGK
ncbi:MULTISPECIES: MerR family transcriptional regulator [Paenibacillus]|uniref:MerR family transcriptional regulator n=1 Tax=Paenibacillus campinasensis TaxID=66347 RepID=A0A268EQD7_9BACL|nr:MULTISPECIES: MerR family transcriptional regulator [Paenibacillus]MUG68032.1 MerR family transcriptional regulator [Paenibacillus campinasensis]PAD75316.1 MerR family transcriptional regulator [Paenibacillus campinasensis]PAK55784.1 MerR family transcriptional regulator [Paenibacillus sp. 7541]